MQAFSYVLGGLFAYFTMGSITVLTTAYVHYRLTGRRWFSKQGQYEQAGDYGRWATDQDSGALLPPVVFFVLWPIALPGIGVIGIVRGFFRATEAIGDKLIATAEEQRKRIGNFRSNPT